MCKKPWKWIHTPSCPKVEEYGGWNKLHEYCLKCLEYVLWDTSSDWHRYSYVELVLKTENLKIFSLQDHCIKQIIEKNVKFGQLPANLKDKIQLVIFNLYKTR